MAAGDSQTRVIDYRRLNFTEKTLNGFFEKKKQQRYINSVF